jgi:hypothetical protein
MGAYSLQEFQIFDLAVVESLHNLTRGFENMCWLTGGRSIRELAQSSKVILGCWVRSALAVAAFSLFSVRYEIHEGH